MQRGDHLAGRKMLTRFKRKWLRLWHSQPGRRFQNYYRRTHRQKNSDEMAPRIGRLVMAVVFFVVGICLVVFPLIYVPFFVLSAAMLASESQRAARILDHGEAWSRGHWASTQQRFGSRTVKITVWIFGIGCLVLAGRTCYNTFMR
jgi:uncharacterized membrane protein YbaN (DUF454 family)